MENRVDIQKSLEQLEGFEWPAPPDDATGLVKAAHSLRKRPIGSLNAHELGRLIGQDIGLAWLLPIAVKILRETVADQRLSGSYDDDLLTAVLTRKSDVWRSQPQLAATLKEIVPLLEDISPYIRVDIQEFLTETEA
ncbi:contact-dependent growth inhibition system immunity protein [Streptomyces cyaneofuscatus]|uniref:contact-dependent growth inhibition system immunity protein n=1 Tax=Streptomyces cyaneofuscatus TaxID=66883 RepID=UPI0033B6FBE3